MTGSYGLRSKVTCALVAAAMAYGRPAGAFELKTTKSGLPVHWAESHVSFVVDPSVGKAVRGGATAATAALAGWSGVSGGPSLDTTPGEGGGKVAVDGVNTILFAPEGYEAAGAALAVTFVSFDETTGAIVDADVVINGKYRFAVLPASARPSKGAIPVSTESGSASPHESNGAFDLEHVIAHEVGHALGLADDEAESGALMYAFSTPGDARVRHPATDDVDGIAVLYASSSTTSGSGSEAQATACQSNVAASPPSRPDLVALGATLAAAWGLSVRRRVRAVSRASVLKVRRRAP